MYETQLMSANMPLTENKFQGSESGSASLRMLHLHVAACDNTNQHRGCMDCLTLLPNKHWRHAGLDYGWQVRSAA